MYFNVRQVQITLQITEFQIPQSLLNYGNK